MRTGASARYPFEQAEEELEFNAITRARGTIATEQTPKIELMRVYPHAWERVEDEQERVVRRGVEVGLAFPRVWERHED